eukprot:COSAG06_NODE_30834_length_531_cov_1.712963_1_plen_32_part_10
MSSHRCIREYCLLASLDMGWFASIHSEAGLSP